MILAWSLFFCVLVSHWGYPKLLGTGGWPEHNKLPQCWARWRLLNTVLHPRFPRFHLLWFSFKATFLYVSIVSKSWCFMSVSCIVYLMPLVNVQQFRKKIWYFFEYINKSVKNYLSNTSLAAQGALAHRLQRRTACNAAPPAMPLRPTYTPQIKKPRSLLYSNLGGPLNFRKTSFLIRATFCLPSPYGGRQTSLGLPKSKKRRSPLYSNMGAANIFR